MKIPARKIITAIIFGITLTVAGFSSAQSHEVICKIQTLKNDAPTEQRQEFWKKFRESVKPHEENQHHRKNPQNEGKPNNPNNH